MVLPQPVLALPCQLRQLTHAVIVGSAHITFFEENHKKLIVTGYQIIKFHGCSFYHFKVIHPYVSTARQLARQRPSSVYAILR